MSNKSLAKTQTYGHAYTCVTAISLTTTELTNSTNCFLFMTRRMWAVLWHVILTILLCSSFSSRIAFILFFSAFLILSYSSISAWCSFISLSASLCVSWHRDWILSCSSSSRRAISSCLCFSLSWFKDEK